jgi:hypothetical protein
MEKSRRAAKIETEKPATTSISAITVSRKKAGVPQ